MSPGRSRWYATADGHRVPREEDLDWTSYVGWFEPIGGELSWVGPCPGCGQRKRLNGAAVLGKHRPDKLCTPRCEAAVGPDCECACAGLNHGSAHA